MNEWLALGIGVLLLYALSILIPLALIVFLAVIIPASKKSKIILGVVIVSMAASFAMEVIPVFGAIASGTRTILLTVVIASAAAILFPVKEEEHGA